MKLVRALLAIPFVQYFIIGVGALAVDMASLLLLLRSPLPAGLCAMIAYTLGIVANWILLSRSLFRTGTIETGRARTQQKLVFLIATWGGLAVTTGIVSLADLAGINVLWSKGVAVGISFVLNYFVRKHFIFTAAKNPASFGRESVTHG